MDEPASKSGPVVVMGQKSFSPHISAALNSAKVYFSLKNFVFYFYFLHTSYLSVMKQLSGMFQAVLHPSVAVVTDFVLWKKNDIISFLNFLLPPTNSNKRNRVHLECNTKEEATEPARMEMISFHF